MKNSASSSPFRIRRLQGYSRQKEVMRMTHRWANLGRRVVRHSWLALLLVGLLVFPGLTTAAQEEPVVQRIFQTLTLLPEADLSALVQLAVALDLAPDLHAAFMEAPRDYLAGQALTAPISLAADAFQVTAIDFSIVPEAAEDAWFGIAEPLEGLVFEPKGVGIFYRNVGVFLQEAREPAAGESAGGMGINNGTPIQQVQDMLALVNRLTPGALDNLRTAMKDLNKLAVDSAERASFLRNPREYLLGRELTLPASTYRIVAIDFERAVVVGAVKSDRIRAGLAVIPEGIGVFGTEVGIFLQLAI
jgi:hypothetical protein